MSQFRLPMILAVAVASGGLVAAAVMDRPAVAQIGGGALSVQVSAAAANGGNSQAWIVDPRTNAVIFCQIVSGKPSCAATSLPGSVRP